jgi:hypothetical protein
VNKLARGKFDRNPHGATALNVNADTAHARGGGGGENFTKSSRNAVRLIEQAESTTQKSDRLRLGAREDENATELKGILTSSSS